MVGIANNIYDDNDPDVSKLPVKNLKSAKTIMDTWYSLWQKAIVTKTDAKRLVDKYKQYATYPVSDPLRITYESYLKKYNSAVTVEASTYKHWSDASANYRALQKAYPYGQPGVTTTTTPPVTGGTTTPDAQKKPTGNSNYNLSGAAENYLTGLETTQTELGLIGNKPTGVDDARDLWKTQGTHKGMFQTWKPPTVYSNYTVQQSGKDVTSVGETQTNMDLTVYGFQFLYNPSSISMDYRGVLDIDMSMYTSGKEKFNPSGPAMSQSTISFDLIINRMHDMKYINPKNTPKAAEKDSTLTGDYRIKKMAYSPSVYANREPVLTPDSKNELKLIYNKGTMYDVEFLLKTLLGYQLHSQLRDEMTSDMGWVSPRPVELHLGNNMRYLVFVGGFSIKHIIFDSRMVPLLTSMSITCNRIPDFDGGKK